MAGKQKGNQILGKDFLFCCRLSFYGYSLEESKERGFPLLRFPGNATIILGDLWASNHSSASFEF